MKKFFLIILLTICSFKFSFSQNSFSTAQAAELMLSGIDFNNCGGGNLLNHPTGLATDGNKLLVCDRWNNRILIWNTAPNNSEAPPDLVLGQSNFTDNLPGTTKNKFNWVGNISLSANGTLVAADTYNDRILIWKKFPTSNGEAADIELNLPQIMPTPDSIKLRNRWEWPWGVWTNGSKLVVTCTHGNSLLFWDNIPSYDNQKPTYFLVDTTWGTLRNITSNGNYFMVSDHNSKEYNNSPATYCWNSFPTLQNSKPNFSIKGWYKGFITDESKLIAGALEHIAIWNSIPSSNLSQPDIRLLPSTYKNGDGPDIAIVKNKMYACNYNGNNILVWNSIPTNNTQEPDFSLCSNLPTENTLFTKLNLIQNPSISSNGVSLFVTSDFDKTLNVWKNLPTKSGVKPDATLHLQEAPWQSALFNNAFVAAGKNTLYIWDKLPINAEQPTFTLNNFLQGFNNEILGVAVDSNFIFVNEAKNRKLFIWEIKNLATSKQPDYIINTAIPLGRLHSNNEILIAMTPEQAGCIFFNINDLINGKNSPSKVVNFQPLNLPSHAITLGKDGFAISNTSGNVVYVWDKISDVGDMKKVIILGGENASNLNKPSNSKNGLFMPATLCYDGVNLWVGEFKFSSRILKFSPKIVTNVLPVFNFKDLKISLF